MKKTAKQRAKTMAMLTRQMVENSQGKTIIIAYSEDEGPINAGHIQSTMSDNFVLMSNLLGIMGGQENEQRILRDLFTAVVAIRTTEAKSAEDIAKEVVEMPTIAEPQAEVTAQDVEELADDLNEEAKAMRKAEDDELNARSEELERKHMKP